MIPKLTLKQRKFWKCYCQTHSLAKSAKAAGSNGKNTSSLSVIGYQILKSLQLEMPELLEAKGLTDESMVDPLKDGINAKKPLIATWEGRITDQLWVEDHPTRAKFLEMYHRLNGNFVDRHELTGKDGGEILFAMGPATKKREKKGMTIE